MKEDQSILPSHFRLYAAEMVGTGLMLLAALSFVILMFGEGNPIESFVPSMVVRRFFTGLAFGSVGATIAVSPIGKVSGAHLNPIVTMGFWLMGKLKGRTAVGYVLAQFVGATLGCLPLLVWGSMGRSVQFGATLPGEGYGISTVLMGEVITTFCLVTGLCLFLAFHRLRRFTPLMFPILFAVMVPLEAGISGTSVNPARSLGPAIISGQWHGWWIYWVGPFIGGLLAILVCNSLAKRIEVAKLYHFDSDPEGLLRRVQRQTVAI